VAYGWADVTADYDPLTLPAAYFEGLPTGVPNNLPSQPEPVAHIHTPVMVAAACECGERMVWDTQRDELSAVDHNWAAVLRRIFA
jgi:hypothetical protein